MDCLYIILELVPNDFHDLLSQRVRVNGKTDFNSFINVAVHPVRRSKKHEFLTTIMKNKYPAVLEVPVNNAPDRNVFTHTSNTRDQRANTSHDEVYFYTRIRSFIQLFDQHRFFKII